MEGYNIINMESPEKIGTEGFLKGRRTVSDSDRERRQIIEELEKSSVAPKSLVEYIESLIRKDDEGNIVEPRAIKLWLFLTDIKRAQEIQDITDQIEQEKRKGLITEEQKNRMLLFLGESLSAELEKHLNLPVSEPDEHSDGSNKTNGTDLETLAKSVAENPESEKYKQAYDYANILINQGKDIVSFLGQLDAQTPNFASIEGKIRYFVWDGVLSIGEALKFFNILGIKNEQEFEFKPEDPVVPPSPSPSFPAPSLNSTPASPVPPEPPMPAEMAPEEPEKEPVYDVPLMQASVGDIVMGEPGWGGPLKIMSKSIDSNNPYFYLGDDSEPRKFFIKSEQMDRYRAARKEHATTELSQPIAEVVPESEIIPTEKDLKENYDSALSLFGEQPFIFEDFVWHAQGLDWENAKVDEKILATKIFQTLLADGKFKKVGDGSNKYKVVSKKATSVEPAPAPISVPVPVEAPQPEPVVEVLYNDEFLSSKSKVTRDILNDMGDQPTVDLFEKFITENKFSPLTATLDDLTNKQKREIGVCVLKAAGLDDVTNEEADSTFHEVYERVNNFVKTERYNKAGEYVRNLVRQDIDNKRNLSVILMFFGIDRVPDIYAYDAEIRSSVYAGDITPAEGRDLFDILGVKNDKEFEIRQPLVSVPPPLPPQPTPEVAPKFEITEEQKQKCERAKIYIESIISKLDPSVLSDIADKGSLNNFCTYLDGVIAGTKTFDSIKEKIRLYLAESEAIGLYKIFGFENGQTVVTEEPDTEATRVIPLPAEEILAPAGVSPQPEVLPVIQTGKIPPAPLPPPEVLEKRDELVLGVEEIKSIVTSLIGGKAKINSFDLKEMTGGLQMFAELDAGFTGGKIKIECEIINVGNNIVIDDLDIDARGYVESMIRDKISSFPQAIKNYFEEQQNKKVQSIQIVGSTLVVDFTEPLSPPLPTIKTAPQTPPEIPITPVVPETLDLIPPPLRMPPPVTSKTPENIPVVDQDLEDMKNRAKPYAAAQIALKNKNRENKNRLFKIASDLAGSVGLGETTEDIVQNRGFIHRTTRGVASKVGFGLEQKTDEIFRKLNEVTPQNMLEVKDNLIKAESNYILAKKEKMRDIRLASVTDTEIKNVFPDYDPTKTLTPEERSEKEYAVLQFRIMAQTEKEWDTLQKVISESIPPQEKGRVGRAFENWAKRPMWQRVAISSAAMTGVGLLLGTVGVDAEHTLAAVVAYRTGRSLVGAFAGQAAGKMTDVITKRSLKKDEQKRLSKYAEGLTGDNYEFIERRLMEVKEEEEKRKKRGILKKAGAMMIVGAGVNIGTDLTLAHHFNLATGAMPKGQHGFLYKMFHRENVPKAGDTRGVASAIDQKPGAGNDSNGTKLNPNVSPSADHLPGPKPGTGLVGAEKPPVSAIPRAEAPTPLKSPVPIELTPKVSESVNVAEVELNKLGFIKTFQELKAELKLKYPNPDATDVPTGVKHFLTTPSTKLAQEYGFWNTKAGTSGMGLKGEHLAVDAEGHLKLEHLAGKPTEVIDTSANKFDTLHADKMHIFKAPVPHEVVAPKVAEHVASDTAVETHPQSNEILPENPSEQINTLESATPHIGRVYDAHGTEIIRGANPVSHIENVVAPKAPFEHIVRGEFREPVVPGAKVAETLHSTLDFTHHSASGMDLHIKVTEAIAGQKYISVGDTAIANELHLPDGSTRMQLFDNLQNGKQSAVFREAFVTAQEKMSLSMPKGASAGYHLFFENRQGGVIDVVHGLPKDPNAVQVLLNGKEIAKGLATVKGPKLTLDPTLHHSWILPETAYDRAFNFLKKTIKLKDNSYILNDLTLPKVVNK